MRSPRDERPPQPVARDNCARCWHPRSDHTRHCRTGNAVTNVWTDHEDACARIDIGCSCVQFVERRGAAR
jgi:hypothetical protein